MEAFDQPWKAKIEGAIGAYWGVYNTEREPKFLHPAGGAHPALAGARGLSVVMAVLLLVLSLPRQLDPASKRQGLPRLVTYVISTAAVWIVYDYTRQYMTRPRCMVGILLLVGGIGVIVLLMAEAHEWAESLWLRSGAGPSPCAPSPTRSCPSSRSTSRPTTSRPSS
jgi:hypothetical protein